MGHRRQGALPSESLGNVHKSAFPASLSVEGAPVCRGPEGGGGALCPTAPRPCVLTAAPTPDPTGQKTGKAMTGHRECPPH